MEWHGFLRREFLVGKWGLVAKSLVVIRDQVVVYREWVREILEIQNRSELRTLKWVDNFRENQISYKK